MKYLIRYETRGYLRAHIPVFEMDLEQADKLEYYLKKQDGIDKVKVNERTADVVIYHHDKDLVLKALDGFSYDLIDEAIESGRTIRREGEDRIFWHLSKRAITRFFLPASLSNIITCIKAVKFVYAGLSSLLRGKMEVAVLDATAISAAILTGDPDTGASIMFLLGLSEILEDWTRKKSEDDLARALALNVEKTWLIKDGKEVPVSLSEVYRDDVIVVRKGNIIPLDGVIVKGDLSVNQASMTGESASVHKDEGVSVYAGTVVEEGEAQIKVSSVSGNSHYDQIVEMIRSSEKLKSSLEDQAFAISDRLVPLSLGATALVYLISRNVTTAMSVLMVDYSCALKLSMPIAVLSAMQEASVNGITVKGGKYFENLANGDTIVFDKTGTLTYSQPKVNRIVTFEKLEEDEALKLAACMEEHYPHSIANAIVAEAKKRKLDHDEELHSKIEYVVAHGVAALVNGKKALLGSYHFVFEDNRCVIPQKEKIKFNQIPSEYSHLYLSLNNRLAAVICIEDPIRTEAEQVIVQLKQLGIKRTVMLTGDNYATAASVAKRLDIDSFYSEVLPDDKAKYIKAEKENGHCVIMLGDGINDSPALSEADVGIAVSEGAPIARQVADITINSDTLHSLVKLRILAKALQNKVSGNYRMIMSFNTLLIILGIFGILPPATAAYLHNGSTLAISLMAARPLQKNKENGLQITPCVKPIPA